MNEYENVRIFVRPIFPAKEMQSVVMEISPSVGKLFQDNGVAWQLESASCDGLELVVTFGEYGRTTAPLAGLLSDLAALHGLVERTK